MRGRGFGGSVVAAAILVLSSGSGRAAAAAPPNIVVILADDLGHGDLSIEGGDIPTPRIDSIARDGVRFAAGYVTAPVCNPSRAGLMSGRYQQRWGQELNSQTEPPDTAPRISLPRTERTLGASLQALGYRTGAIGKWHLGMQPGYHPLDRGFGEFFGTASGTRYIDRGWPGVHFMGPADPSVDDGDDSAAVAARPAGNRRGLFRGREPAELEEYVTDQFAREAIEFIERHRAEPFFLYLAFNAPHTPLEVTDVYYRRFPHFEDERKRIYAAMISALDDNVGRVLDRIDAIGARDRTLVVFLSDNGCPDVVDTDGRCNAPFLGHKRHLYEGGTHLPFFMRWPQRLPSGSVYPEPVSTLDLFPTFLAAAGAQAPPASDDRPLDGVDLLPFVTGAREGAPHDALYWRSGPNGAMRQGRYKLLLGGDDVVRLYDVVADVHEDRDLSAEMPERVAAMKAAWAAWNAELSQPRSSGRTTTTRYHGDVIRWHI